MKHTKNHLMFILSLISILLGVEFFMVFDRTTDSYEDGLKKGYSILVVSEVPRSTEQFHTLNSHITQSEAIDREAIVTQYINDISKEAKTKLIGNLPYFYSLHLDSYIDASVIQKIKTDLLKDIEIRKVETFGEHYLAKYRLFMLVKFMLRIFILFLSVVSFFLIIKQMEIWKYAHKDRMQIMELFGATMTHRSGVLFRIALIDAVLSMIIVSTVFAYTKYVWAMQSNIDIVTQHYEKLFRVSDIAVLLLSAFVLVITSVYWVVYSTKGVQE